MKKTLTRREWLHTTAATATASIYAALLGACFGRAALAQNTPVPAGSGAMRNTFSYFTEAETAFLDAALDRLIPSDRLSAGAREAGGTLFIDQQMDGPYGRAERWYMEGPWKEGTEEQGYQLKLTPAQLYRSAIGDIDDYCRQNYAKKVFARLAAADQDKVLHGLESGDIKLAHAPAKAFFEMLWQNTMESFLADPMYGGNRRFAGWKLIGFPGPRYNYVGDIERYGKRYLLPTVGLLGRDGLPAAKG